MTTHPIQVRAFIVVAQFRLSSRGDRMATPFASGTPTVIVAPVAASSPNRVIERHSCEYGAHRFGHVILQYRGRVVSLLVTANDRATAAAESAAAIPHLLGRPVDGLSLVSVNGSRHAIMLVSDLERTELTQLARIVSLPLVERLADARPERSNTTASLFGRPIQELARYSDRRPVFAAGLPKR